MSSAALSDVRNVLEQGLATYDISVTGDLHIVSRNDLKYEVEVPFGGELLLDETLANHGPLLYNRDGEIAWKGVRDGKLYITVDLDN